MTAWFASDLHLNPSTPEIAERFQRFLEGPVQGARSLFLLGDLFEAWLGDDDPEPAHQAIVASLARIAGCGTLVYVMHGNRDFMLGDRFCRDAGVILLDDPSILEMDGKRLVLSHGDGLCVDDRAYQRLRALVREPDLRERFAKLPIEARRRLALEARAGSREHLANASSYITDVNAAAVESAFRESGATIMIHGHTHRPGVHQMTVDGLDRTRIVLGAWHDQADVVRWEKGDVTLIPSPEFR